MHIPNFIGTVRQIDYKMIVNDETKEPKKYYSAIELEAFYDIFGENVSQWDYYAQIKLQAPKKGRSKSTKRDIWSCIVYLTEDEFTEQPIEVGDIIELQTPTLKKKDFKLVLTDPEQLKEAPPSRLKRKYLGNEDCTREHKGETCGKCVYRFGCEDKAKHYMPIAIFYVSDCRISARAYKMCWKADDVFRAIVGGVKLSFDSLDEMNEFSYGEYYILADEAATITQSLLEAGGKPLEMKFYSKSKRVRAVEVECKLHFDDKVQTNLLTISVLEKK